MQEENAVGIISQDNLGVEGVERQKKCLLFLAAKVGSEKTEPRHIGLIEPLPTGGLRYLRCESDLADREGPLQKSRSETMEFVILV